MYWKVCYGVLPYIAHFIFCNTHSDFMQPHNNMKIYFVLRKNKTDKKKLATVYFRIKLKNEKISNLYSTGIRVMPDCWDNKTKQVTGKYAQADNDTLDLIRYNLKTIFNSLMLLKKPFKAIDVINDFFGKSHKQIGIMEMYDKFIEAKSKTKKAESTLRTYGYKKNY